MSDEEGPVGGQRADTMPGWHFSRETLIRWVLFFAVVVTASFLYCDFGMNTNAVKNRSIFFWLTQQWCNKEFKYNWVMLIFSAYLIWKDRWVLAEMESEYAFGGVFIVAFSLAAHIFGYRSQMPRISLASVVGVYWGAVYALWGRRIAMKLLFPAAYTLFCFTSSLLREVTWPLRIMASSISVTLLHGVGIEAVRQGTIVHSSAGGGFAFNVADACSGLRSLSVIVSLAAPYAYLTMTGLRRKWILFLLSVPLAMLANALRIFTLGVVAEWIGMDLAMTLYHDLSGYIALFIALGLLVVTGSLLERIGKRGTA